MKKITAIHFPDGTSAIEAAMCPFGSLSSAYGVDTPKLAEEMVAYLNATLAEKFSVAGRIVKILFAAETDDVTSVEFGAHEVALRTPTSHTVVALRCDAGGIHLTVDLGKKGSTTRALQILGAAELACGVSYSAYSGDHEVPRKVIVQALLRSAKQLLAYRQRQLAEAPGHGPYQGNVTHATETVARFASILEDIKDAEDEEEMSTCPPSVR